MAPINSEGVQGSAAGAVYPALSAVAETYIALARKVYRYQRKGIYFSGETYIPFVGGSPTLRRGGAVKSPKALPRYNEEVP